MGKTYPQKPPDGAVTCAARALHDGSDPPGQSRGGIPTSRHAVLSSHHHGGYNFSSILRESWHARTLPSPGLGSFISLFLHPYRLLLFILG